MMAGSVETVGFRPDEEGERRGGVNRWVDVVLFMQRNTECYKLTGEL